MNRQELVPIAHNYKALRGHGACQIYALDPHVVRFQLENPGSDVLGEERTDQSDRRSLHSRFNTFFKRQEDSPARWVSQCVDRDALEKVDGRDRAIDILTASELLRWVVGFARAGLVGEER